MPVGLFAKIELFTFSTFGFGSQHSLFLLQTFNVQFGFRAFFLGHDEISFNFLAV